MKWDERQALGCLAFLWHDSQELEKSYATVTEIEVWCRCKSEREAERLTQALVMAGYLIPSETGSFYIKGNKEQIESLRSHRKRAKAGGEATRKKWENADSNDSNNLDENEGASSPPQAQHKPTPQPGLHQAQCNSKQSNAKQRTN